MGICKKQIVLQKNLIFFCSRKADLELIYKTSLWELFWFDPTWHSYMPAKRNTAWIKSLDGESKTCSVSTLRITSMAKCKVSTRALPEPFLFQFCPVLALLIPITHLQMTQSWVGTQVGGSKFLGSVEKGHENQGQLQGNAPREEHPAAWAQCI